MARQFHLFPNAGTSETVTLSCFFLCDRSPFQYFYLTIEAIPKWIYTQSDMVQYTRSMMSDSFASKDVIDSPSYRFGPDRSPPTKRVRRLLHDPTRIQPMEQIFSEYDWRTDSFAPTLRMASHPTSFPPRRPKSSISHLGNFIDPARPPNIIPLLNPAVSSASPSVLHRVPDEVRLSSYFLASQGTDTGGDASPLYYSTSPISRDQSSQWSPLQQFIASCETREEEFPSSHIPMQRRDRARKPRGSRRTFELDSSVESDRTIVTGRSRTNTWDSDVTTFDGVDGVSSLEGKRKSIQQLSPPLYTVDVSSVGHNSFFTPSTNIVEDRMHMELDMHPEGDVDMSGAARPPTQHTLLQPSDLWTLWEGEDLTNDSTLPAGRTLSSNPLTRKRKLEIEETHLRFDTPEVVAEDETTPTPRAKKSLIAIFASALHHRYVSLCLRIQLDMFRVERQVKRKLRDPWLK